MTEELTTRGPFDSDPGVLVRWMLKSGQRVNRPIGNVDVERERTGIQLYVPSGGRIVELDLADVHEAGDLYVALEAHMENVAGGALLEVQMMTAEEREAMTPNTPKVIDQEARQILMDHQVTEDRIRRANMAAVQEQLDNPIPVEDPGQSPVWALDREFLAAMEDVLERWLSAYHEGHQDRLRTDWPSLAAALDKLAALNA